MLKAMKTKILAAVLMTASLGISQGAFAQETEAPEENAVAVSEETTTASRPHPIVSSISINDDEYTTPDDYSSYVLYALLQYSKVSLPADEAEAFPALNQSLNDYYAAQEAKKLENFEELKTNARDRYAEVKENGQLEFWGYFSDCESSNIVRADDRILSIRGDFYNFEGGQHGYYTRYGATFDTQTGQQLSFTDVVTDPAAAAAHTFEKLQSQYPDLEPLLSQEEVAQSFQENSDSFSWTLEPTGMMIYFPPYLLASYAEGMQAVLLPYSEFPELFASQYVSDTDEWIVPIDTLFGVMTDPATGMSVVNVSGTMGDSSQYTDRIITVDSTPYSFGQDSLGYYDSTSYLISSNGKFWVWCQDSLENDYESLHIYSIENGTPADTDYSDLICRTVLTGSFEDSKSQSDLTTLTDPGKINLTRRMHIIGTYGAAKDYFVSGNGTPVSDNPFYTPVSERTLTLKVPVTLKMVGQDGTGEETKEWPAGTTCTILRTDGNQIVDFVMDNDETQVARVASDFSTFPHYINGMDEAEVFDDIRYAG